jgi:hypothetical protein
VSHLSILAHMVRTLFTIAMDILFIVWRNFYMPESAWLASFSCGQSDIASLPHHYKLVGRHMVIVLSLEIRNGLIWIVWEPVSIFGNLPRATAASQQATCRRCNATRESIIGMGRQDRQCCWVTVLLMHVLRWTQKVKQPYTSQQKQYTGALEPTK